MAIAVKIGNASRLSIDERAKIVEISALLAITFAYAVIIREVSRIIARTAAILLVVLAAATAR